MVCAEKKNWYGCWWSSGSVMVWNHISRQSELVGASRESNGDSDRFGYGAAAKGNTLLNYAGIKSDLILGVADKAPSKQGKYLPGSHIKIISPEQLFKSKPDSIIILPWNLIDELKNEFKGYETITAIPQFKIYARK